MPAVLAFPVAAQVVTIDGDTIRLNGTTYRLHGIDAAESRQWCGDYPAGAIATGMLAAMIRDRDVVCEPKTKDRYGRVVAICRADGQDLGKAMVRLGAALAFTRYSADYVADEDAARAEGLGVHGRGLSDAMGIPGSPAEVTPRYSSCSVRHGDRIPRRRGCAISGP